LPTIVRAFIVYIRPLIEHDSILWSPLLKQDIEKLERVQRSFTKRRLGFSDLSYEDRLRRLDLRGLRSLKLRRLRTDWTCVIQLCSVVFNLNQLTFLTQSNRYQRANI